MCGIAGIWHPDGRIDVGLTAAAMADRMIHRGPDDAGVWSDQNSGISFGFRRLAIVDLTANGHQPMQSASGRYTMVFNGEVYNYREIGLELGRNGIAFRGHSDTEVILAAFERWGIEIAVERFIGMFAIAVWDAQSRSLTLIRDRLGIKPMFVYRHGGTLAFASELKAFASVPGFNKEIDGEALASYFRHLYVPAPLSIFRHVRKLLPGHIQKVRFPGDEAPPRPYWSIEDVARRGMAEPFRGDDTEAVTELESVLRDAVRLRMRADVPLGAFLSGGIDSSTVVALMQESTSQPVRTYTIGFDDREHDESIQAAAIARYLGTDHQTRHLSGDEAVRLVPRLSQVFDEPLADPSQIPTYLVCAAAKEDLTVAISGDGGDELFAGYNRYASGARLIRRAHMIPSSLRRAVSTALTAAPAESWDYVQRGIGAATKASPRLLGEKVNKLGAMLRENSDAEMYVALLSAWSPPPYGAYSGTDKRLMAALRSPYPMSLLNRMMLGDQIGYLPDDLLAKVDRASMATSLEVRVPILDHRVVELSWKMATRYKIRNGKGKWLLRQVLNRRVPQQLVDRPKVGFSVPLDTWLKGPLRPWANDLLQPERLKETSTLDVGRIVTVWKNFLEGRNRAHLAIWTILMYEMWRADWSN